MVKEDINTATVSASAKKKIRKKTTRKAVAKKTPVKKKVVKQVQKIASTSSEGISDDGAVKVKAAKKDKVSLSAKKNIRTKKVPAKKSKSNGQNYCISADRRQELIEKAAFLISTKRHSGYDDQHKDWLQAEVVIDMIFSVDA